MSEVQEQPQVEEQVPSSIEQGHRAPEDVAALQFKAYLPRFDNICATLPKGGLRRVLKALIHSPLEDYPSLQTKEEKEAFAIGTALQDAKFMMVMCTFNERLEQIKKQEENKNVEVNA